MLEIFGTDGIRCKVNQEPMTADTCLKIAKAAGHILSIKTTKKNRSNDRKYRMPTFVCVLERAGTKSLRQLYVYSTMS